MTRRSDLMLENIIYCNHVGIIPIVENGVILYWLCACGKEIPDKPKVEKSEKPPEGA